MLTLTSRLYAGARDLQSMLDLLVAVRPADRITDYPSLVDLREALALRAVQGNTRLWFEARDLVAFAYVDPSNNLVFEYDRRAALAGVEAQIVAWGVACMRRRMPASGESPTLDASCRAEDAERIALLERHGFGRQEIRSLLMARSLAEPIPAPQAPPGFYIRHAAGEQEVEALVALHRAAFGTQDMTVEERLAMMRVPGYEAELDLLAVAPDGRLAAFCLCWISAEENERSGRYEGYTDPLGTHPDFRRRGLARALMLTGFGLLKQRGVETAVLGTSSANLAMQRAAESVGYRLQSARIWFARPLSQDQADD